MCRSTLAGIYHDQKLHQAVIDRLGSRLNDENVFAADTLTDHHLGFTVVEMTDVRITELHTDVVCNLFCQFRVRITRKDA